MLLASLSLFLIAMHICGRVECRPWLQRLHQHQAAAHADSGLFFVDLRGSGRDDPHRGNQVILPVTAAPTSLLVFDWRRRRYRCVDIKGRLYKSRQKLRERCLLGHVQLSRAERRDLLSFVKDNWSVQLGGPSPVLLERQVKRRRRSEEVNPSDPLRTEAHPPPPAKDAKQTQAGAVSKETITSCDDPLRVLRPNGHGSPVKTNIADQAGHQ